MPYKLLMAHRAGSVFAGRQGVSTSRHRYTPFGALQPFRVCSQSAFTGQWVESTARLYMLGAGYRSYQSTLGRFTQPDRYSPFGEGGRNTYAYCAGDPVNRIDTTGCAFTSSIIGGLVSSIGMTALHITNLASKSVKTTPASLMWGTRLALLASGASVAAGVLAGLQANQQAQRSLFWTNIGLSVASVALRISVSGRMIWKAEWRKIVGRVSGLQTGGNFPMVYLTEAFRYVRR